jgi:hypothetical protein
VSEEPDLNAGVNSVADAERARLNERASDRERERQSVEAIRHLSVDVGELVDLRGRIAVAKAILGRGGDRQAAINALNGDTISPPIGDEHNPKGA